MTPRLFVVPACRLAFGFACMSVASCGDNQDDAGARDLLARVRTENYRAWARGPGYETRRPSNAPHSNAVDIYVNLAVEMTLTKPGTAEWPVGSIIAKDGYDGSDHEIIALMEKLEDGWFWAEYDADGTPVYSGKPDICIDCHKSGNDGVRAFRLP